jgi:predicted Zn-dependent peptidase
LVARELSGDLLDMTSGADPQRVKEVRRDHLQEVLVKQIIGNAATLSVVGDVRGDQLEALPDALAVTVDRFIREERARFEEKRARAVARYDFIERPVYEKRQRSSAVQEEPPF